LRYFEETDTTLVQAEERALEMTCHRAELADGQEILELGSGWGSLALWMAERYPHSRITAVSNSGPQRQFIEHAAAARGLNRLRVVTADMNHFSAETGAYDRVVSVEMFEHMRNYELLFARTASWLAPSGKLFVHVFCHRELTYPFDAEGAANWMGRYFFSGGIMPGAGLYRSFNKSLRVTKQHAWNGQHYQRTAEAWLANLDRRQGEILPILAKVYGPKDAARWLNRWRMFFLAVAAQREPAGSALTRTRAEPCSRTQARSKEPLPPTLWRASSKKDKANVM
jgi:cyclopropane-fatty-acyl-phospholipid synthase